MPVSVRRAIQSNGGSPQGRKFRLHESVTGALWPMTARAQDSALGTGNFLLLG